jgi:ubiquinone/menaquinone biosynthesis C-methylase UbiE
LTTGKSKIGPESFIYQIVHSGGEVMAVKADQVSLKVRSKQADYDNFYSKKDFIHFKQDRTYIQLLCSFLPNLQKSSVLDVGCGRGYWSKLFYECGAGRVVGVDISSVGLEIARREVPGAEFIQADAENMPGDKNSFDMIFCQGFSGFNVDDISKAQPAGLRLLQYLANDGLFVVACSSNFSGKRKHGWINHKQENIIKFIESLGCRINAVYAIDRVIFLKLLGKNVTNKIFSKYLLPAISSLTALPVLSVCIAQKQPDAASRQPIPVHPVQ